MTTTPTKENNKWYDKTWLVILLCIFFFPMGLYAVWKSTTIPKDWKMPATILVLFYGYMLISIKNTKVPTDITALPTTKENNQTKQSVLDTTQNNNTENSQAIDEEKKKEIETELKKLKSFQKKWTDSIVKTENTAENGYHLVGSKLALPDTILFEYSAETTKYGFEANLQQDEAMYRKWYAVGVYSKLGEKYLAYPIYISCIPNQKLLSKIDKSIEYEHPSLAFSGIKVYKGNEFSKELIGRVSCLYKDPSKGFGDMDAEIVIINGKKGIIKIPHYLFRKNYWTTKEENDISKPVIKCN